MVIAQSVLVGFFSQSMVAAWLVALIAFLVVEGLVPGLVSIWFALGSLAALIAALLHAPVWLQLAWFFVVSIAALILTRPLAKKYINSRVQPTNFDMIIGKECVVTETIDNLHGTGAVSVGGKVWTARALQPDAVFEKDTIAVIDHIEGVKLIIKPR